MPGATIDLQCGKEFLLLQHESCSSSGEHLILVRFSEQELFDTFYFYTRSRSIKQIMSELEQLKRFDSLEHLRRLLISQCQIPS